jgi:hypothetical protein
VFTQAQLVEQLETLVDDSDLSSVITALGLVCGEKAEHLRCNWQDNIAARVWERAERKLVKLGGEDSTIITLS